MKTAPDGPPDANNAEYLEGLTMTALLAETPIVPRGDRRGGFSRMDYLLAGLAVLIWAGVADFAISGFPDAVIRAASGVTAWAAALVTAGLLGMLILERRLALAREAECQARTPAIGCRSEKTGDPSCKASPSPTSRRDGFVRTEGNWNC